MVDKHIFCIWSDSNKMSPNRRDCLELIKKNSGCKVYLVTSNSLKEWTQNISLHEGYQYLSSVHKSDYLRAYLLHYYGGGYTDIKRCQYDWNPYFDVFNNDSSKLVCGYREISSEGLAIKNLEEICPNQKLHTKYLQECCYSGYFLGCGKFIVKRKTEFTESWLKEVDNILSEKLEKLKKHNGNYHPRAAMGDTYQGYPSKYPISWNEIMGSVFHKLCYNYKKQIMPIMPFIDTNDYR